MAIAKQCYIRDISKKHQKLLEKASKQLELKTTPSILLKTLEEYFSLQIDLNNSISENHKLKEKNIKALQELADMKNQMKLILKMEQDITARKLQLQKIL